MDSVTLRLFASGVEQCWDSLEPCKLKAAGLQQKASAEPLFSLPAVGNATASTRCHYRLMKRLATCHSPCYLYPIWNKISRYCTL